MSGEFDSRKDTHSTKLERRPQIFVKLSFRELRGSKLSGLHPFDNMVYIRFFRQNYIIMSVLHSNLSLNPLKNKLKLYN